MTNHKLLILLAVCLFSLRPHTSEACTGITLKSRDGSTVVARTIEWGGSNLNSRYVIVPRGYIQQSLLPDGKKNGLVFTAQYGYVGMAVEQDEIVAEGINEAGLSAGLFYFPHYGQYETYDPAQKTNSLADIQLVSWILGNFDRIEDVQNAIKKNTGYWCRSPGFDRTLENCRCHRPPICIGIYRRETPLLRK